MSSVAGGGLSREPGEMWNILLLDATSLDGSGYVLKYVVEDSKNKVDKCGATDTPVCLNYRSTRDPFDLRETDHGDLIGSKLVGIAVYADGWARIKVANDNATIVRGDYLVVSSVTSQAGKVDKYVATTIDTDLDASELIARFAELSRVVGRAEEDVAAGDTTKPGKDKVLARLTIGNVGK